MDHKPNWFSLQQGVNNMDTTKPQEPQKILSCGHITGYGIPNKENEKLNVLRGNCLYSAELNLDMEKITCFYIKKYGMLKSCFTHIMLSVMNPRANK